MPHPLIVKELLGWISDSSATVVGVDLAAANRSNRFYGEFRVKDDGGGRALVEWRDAEASFVYRHVGTAPSGVEIVECHDWLGGSGVFGTVALFCLERDRAVEADCGSLSSRDGIVRGNLLELSGVLVVASVDEKPIPIFQDVTRGYPPGGDDVYPLPPVAAASRGPAS